MRTFFLLTLIFSLLGASVAQNNFRDVTVIKQKLDSAVYRYGMGYPRDTRTDFTYYSNGLVQTAISLKWNVDHYRYLSSLEYWYSPTGQVDSNLYRAYESVSGLWVNAYSEKYSYDVNDRETVNYSYYYDEPTSSWIKESEIYSTYSAAGDLTERLYMQLNSSTMLMENQFKRNFFQDNDHNDTLIVSASWDNTLMQWVNGEKYTKQYNGNHQVTLEISALWDIIAGNWVDNYKTEFAYDVNGNDSTMKQWSWNSTTSLWENQAHIWWDYVANLQIANHYNTWDNVNMEWDSLYQTTFMYDGLQNNTTLIEFTYDEVLPDPWDTATVYNSIFNTTYPFADLVIPIAFYVNYDYNYMKTQMVSYDQNSPGSYTDRNDDRYYFSEMIIDQVSEIPSFHFSVFPNPTNDYLYINSIGFSRYQIEICDLNGRIVYKDDNKGKNSNGVDVSSFENGIYFITLRSDTKTSTKRFVKH